MASTLTEPLETDGRLLRERVYEQLRHDILTCELMPGAEIREAELAARFEVSKSPVRDALISLEREGLVITIPRQGYRVAPVSISDMLDMFHLRAALERANMERIIRHASDEQLEALDQFKHFSASQWPDGFVSYNKSFHRRLAELGGNPRMRDQLIDLIDLMERAVQISVSNMNHGKPEALVAEHREIIEVIQSRSIKTAQRLAEQHVLAAGKRVSNAVSRGMIVN
ncbi:GntR family transcriptional regulator [Polynucleobacter sp.]|jgi:DNA-binding GntR family transcriptional regulator|uniref:GntR family transcriptional regulator n=1 Tax=Polynucleobacter sp. TaxID=2029855 RepID=UPI003018227D